MKIQKIQLKFKSGVVTPLESDTVLGYVFADNFDKLRDVFNQFNKEEAPFVLSNWFSAWFLPKPFYFNKKLKTIDNLNLKEILINEPARKINKSIGYFPTQKDIFFTLFEGENFVEYQQLINQFNERLPQITVTADFKNCISRFQKTETNPYALEQINYLENSVNLYVKIYQQQSFDLFWSMMEKTFLDFGFGKYKSKGYGKFEFIQLEDLTDKENWLFEYLEELKINKGIHCVLNNYLPSNDDLTKIDFEQSTLNIQTKNTKTLQSSVFKGNMNFIYPWSVIFSKQNLKGGYYQVENSFNFGYLF